MTDQVPVNDRRTRLTATNGQTEFGFDFPIAEDTDLTVYTNATLEDPEDYTVDVEAQTVTFDDGRETDDKVIIDGNMPVKRVKAFQRRGEFGSTQVNDDADRLYRMMQEVKREVGEAFKKSPDEAADVSSRLPKAEANRVPKWDADGKSLVNGPTVTEIENAEEHAQSTAADAIATAADRVQTGLDRVATAADAVATAADAIATAADRVQTGLDRVATAADVVQTGNDVIAASGSAAIAAAATGYKYTYDNTTTASDPGAGKIRFDNADLTLATLAYISETTGDAQNAATDIATWDNGTSSIRGRLKIFKRTDPTVFVEYDLTGTNTDDGAWDTLNLTYIGGNGTIANSDVLTVMFSRKGDMGPAGTLDFSGLAAETSPAIDDLLALFDTSEGANNKMTFENFFKVINGLSFESAPDGTNDALQIYDNSSGTAKKIAIANVFKTLTGLTSKTTPVGADELLMNDSAASAAPKKFSITNMFANAPPVITPASASGGSGFRLPHGAAPSSPTNGDVWTTTAGLYARINGVTYGPYSTTSGFGTILSTTTLSGAVASVDITIPSGYKWYELIWDGLDNNGQDLWARIAQGGAYLTAGNYMYGLSQFRYASGTLVDTKGGAAAATKWVVGLAASTSTGTNAGSLRIKRADARPSARWDSQYDENTTTGNAWIEGAGYYNASAAPTNIQLLRASGNLSTGNIVLIGGN